MMLSAPLLLSALAVGLLIGIFQAATQIQEMTLSFIPKLIVLVFALLIAGPWMLRILTEFTLRLFAEIPSLLG
jgi:flagellar biosynthetic protein FliQ